MTGGSAIRVTGLERALVQLNRQLKHVSKVARADLIRRGLLILRESNKIAPRDTSNMAASGFVTWMGKGPSTPKFKDSKDIDRLKSDHTTVTAGEKARIARHELLFGPAVVVGYSAYYTVYVHEDLTAKHKPGKEAKFLEKAADRSVRN